MDRNQAIAQIDEALRDSGNGNHDFYTVQEDLDEGLREADRDGEDEVFIKPSSGYEVTIDADTVRAALTATERDLNRWHGV